MSTNVPPTDKTPPDNASPDKKPTIATMWLDGCSGCHMSLLDLDERLIEIAAQVEFVCGPYVDVKELPAEVDLGIVEGAVSSEEDLARVRELRRSAKFLISLGDCAVTGNVPAMRNGVPIVELMERAYQETAHEPLVGDGPRYPSRYVPALRTRVSPVHEVVNVDLYVPGCPPPAAAIYHVLTELLAGRRPDVSAWTRFGK
ncbi:MAG: hypothetical protein U0939_18465 [Pirellulales bacterium]